MPRKGKNPKPKPLVAVDDVIVCDQDIPKYMTEYFYSCMERWALTKMWGTAHNRGWADEPLEYIQAISTLENEYNKVQNEEMEAKAASVKKPDDAKK